VGKTVAGQEIHKPVIAKKGYFIQGKFEPIIIVIFLYAMIKAYRQLISRLLTRERCKDRNVREKFLSSIRTKWATNQ